jgi:hypothetical protein
MQWRAHSLTSSVSGSSKKLGLFNHEAYTDLHEGELSEIQSHELYKHEMDDHAEDYATFVMERFAEAQAHTSDALIFLERKLNFSEYVPEGFGTGDVVIIADGVLDFIDLKYGKGVLVSAENNKQLMLYALAALREFDFSYDIKRVRMTIYQPRIDNYSSFEMTVEDLLQWAENELKPKAALAFNGEGEYEAGEHCRFCRAKAVCKANADYNLQLAKYEFQDPALLDETEVADILSKAGNIENWLKAVEEYALNAAVNENKKWPGFKLVEGRANRVMSDEKKIVKVLKKNGVPVTSIYKPREVYGITALTKSLGKKMFDTLIGPLLVKPAGKPCLVQATDKRPEYNSIDKVREDFAEDIDHLLIKTA